jgi:acyl-CoA-binding protein
VIAEICQGSATLAAMSDLEQRFTAAQATIKKLTDVGNDVKLELYGLFKQATVGDNTGEEPGMFDLVGRAKFEAWKEHAGKSKDAAMEAYIAAVEKHTK